MSASLCLPFEDWPAADRATWDAARERRSFLSGSTAASQWSPRRCRIVKQAYGQWLAWLSSIGGLDSEILPEDRFTAGLLWEFVAQLEERVAPVSVAMMVGAILRMAAGALAPKRDWSWMSAIYSDLKCAAKSSRNRMAHYVPPKDLYDLGFRLMQEAVDRPNSRSFHPDTTYRDGLLIAALACTLIRIGNFAPIEIGRHLQFDRDGDRYWLSFSETETKTGRPHQCELPPELTRWIDHYLKEVRPRLLARGATPKTARLWIGRDGAVLLEAAIRFQIESRTRAAFGRHVWPHLFRHCGVTGLVDQAPERIDIAPDLLGHASVETTQKYYILATGTIAHKQVQSAFEDGRRQARERLKQRRGGADIVQG